MSKGLDGEFLSQLKSKNDIVEVIGSYVTLERKGSNYWACCPFHHEKTPSFSVNSLDQYYHCFGCGASGDVITFIREIESVDFIDAVRILAERAKLSMPTRFASSLHALMKSTFSMSMTKRMQSPPT